MNFNLLIQFVVVALALSVATRYVSEGLINAWGIEFVWMKRLLVLCVNAFFCWWWMFTQATIQYTYIDYALVLLCVCSGTEALHNIINTLKDVQSEFQEYDIDEPDDVQSDEDEEIRPEGTDGE